ncbi:MAG: hypothetical protein ACYDD0_00605 [Candidatus Dormibacteria bacterium]
MTPEPRKLCDVVALDHECDSGHVRIFVDYDEPGAPLAGRFDGDVDQVAASGVSEVPQLGQCEVAMGCSGLDHAEANR